MIDARQATPKAWVVMAWKSGEGHSTRYFTLQANTKSEAKSRVRRHLGERGRWGVAAYTARYWLASHAVPEGATDLDAA
jgi:hypothetical protein